MARKPAKMYRRVTGPAYTNRKYMGGIPGLRIIQFDMGNTRGAFTHNLTLHLKEGCQVRHTALEAARVAANRYLHKKVGVQNYHLKILIYPHHVLRENKQATGAGADRVSEGMRKAFGKCVGTAARCQRGQAIILLRTNDMFAEECKTALIKAGQKIPSPVSVKIDEAEARTL